jgi:hypothetical protein
MQANPLLIFLKNLDRQPKMSQKAVDVEVQVTWEDQKNINAFGRLNGRMHEFEEDISKKQVPSLSSPPPLQLQAPHSFLHRRSFSTWRMLATSSFSWTMTSQ